MPLKAFLQILEGQHERDHLLDENAVTSFVLLQGMLIIIIIMQTVSQSVSQSVIGHYFRQKVSKDLSCMVICFCVFYLYTTYTKCYYCCSSNVLLLD